jgi:hypothetical protein
MFLSETIVGVSPLVVLHYEISELLLSQRQLALVLLRQFLVLGLLVKEHLDLGTEGYGLPFVVVLVLGLVLVVMSIKLRTVPSGNRTHIWLVVINGL